MLRPSACDADHNKLVEDYFYRYDTVEGGDYIFEDSEWVVSGDDITREGGTPRLADQTTPAAHVDSTDSPAINFSQKLWLADGLDIVNLYYGYVDTDATNYSDAVVQVEINADMTTGEFEDQVNEL